MAGVIPPTAEEQLVFLSKLQRVFLESSFTATYKFALLVSLADLAVEMGADDGERLSLTTRQIAERFVQLYWQQATPYGNGRLGSTPGVLIQNNGKQAAIVTAIADFRRGANTGTVQAARAHGGYQKLLGEVARTVSVQPLTYLQNFGGSTDEFLYERIDASMIVLRPGVAYCLRRFQPLVQQLARTHWIRHVKDNRQNNAILGSADDLEGFLFATSRQSLQVLAVGLRKVDGQRCFYCGQSLTTVDVDHFIPFSLYPRDLVHNFVLAHPGCNRSKSDSLAARQHLERWIDRLASRSDVLAEVGQAAGVIVDAPVSRQVARWGYASARVSGGYAWREARQYEPIDEVYITLLG